MCTRKLISFVLLYLAASAGAARDLLENWDDDSDDGAPVPAPSSPGYCDWGGHNFAEFPWAEPRVERDWYCDLALEFKEEADDRKEFGEGIPMIVFGDSIMQCLRFEGSGCSGVTSWFDRNWAKKYGAVSWALGSETTKSLFWRMLNGNGPKMLGTKAVLMLIGSNNMGQGNQDVEGQQRAAEETLDHVKQMSNWLMEQDDELVVVLMGLLPKTGYGDNGASTGKISLDTLPALEWYNSELRKFGLEEKRVRFVGCWDEFLEEDGRTIKRRYMGEGLHPNLEGFRLMAKRVDPILEEVFAKQKDNAETDVSMSSLSP